MIKSSKICAVTASVAMTVAMAGPAFAQETNANVAASAEAQAQVTLDIQSVIDFAGERAAELVAQLQAAGYQVVDMSRTLLGRVRITLQNDVHIREIVIARSTGEIKQDVIIGTFAPQATGQEPASESAGATLQTQIDVGASGGASAGDGGVAVGGSAGASISLGLGN